MSPLRETVAVPPAQAAPHNKSPQLSVRNLTKYFAVGSAGWRGSGMVLRAVDDVSFDIGRGEAFGIVGESGSGKSTLARTILRLYVPNSGRITFEGSDISTRSETQLRPLRRDMQMIFQDTKSSLNPRLTIRQILAEPLITHRLPHDRIAIVRLLELVGLGGQHLDRYPHELSGGQRQRVGIARALSVNPKLVIADEPVSALDVSIQAQVLNLLKELQQRFGLSVLLIAHDISVVGYFCDRVAVMYLGRIVETGPSRKVMRQPSHPYSRALVSAVPGVFSPQKRDRIVLQGDIPSPLSPLPGCPFQTRCPVKIGAICEAVPPPLRETAPGHWVACHR